jgi:hypothetical protein
VYILNDPDTGGGVIKTKRISIDAYSILVAERIGNSYSVVIPRILG